MNNWDQNQKWVNIFTLSFQIQIYPPLSDKVSNWDQNQKWVHIFRWSFHIQIYPPFSDKVNNWDRNHKWVHMFIFFCDFQLLSFCNWPSLWVHPVYKIQSLFSIIIIFIGNCCHFATDHLHDYIHFTIYHLELHFQCSEGQAISVISPKTCTLKLQLLHNTKRPTKWSGHVKMTDPPENFYIQKTFYPRG